MSILNGQTMYKVGELLPKHNAVSVYKIPYELNFEWSMKTCKTYVIKLYSDTLSKQQKYFWYKNTTIMGLLCLLVLFLCIYHGYHNFRSLRLNVNCTVYYFVYLNFVWLFQYFLFLCFNHSVCKIKLQLLLFSLNK